MKNLSKEIVQICVEKIYNTFEKSSGSMILITTATGVLLSTVAQSLAIILNKKYSVSQKAFMIPQELTDGALSVCTLLITSLILKSTAEKCVESGKIITKDLKSYLQQNNALKNFGTKNYSVSNQISLIRKKIENSNVFKNSSLEAQKSQLASNEDAFISYEQTKDATSAIVTTAGSIISTAIFVPLIRNCIAAKFQPTNINIINEARQKRKEYMKKQLTEMNDIGYNNYSMSDGMRI